MSVKYYAKFWKETCEKIHEALGCENRTQKVGRISHPRKAHTVIAELYARYVLILNDLNDIFEHTQHVEKKEMIERILVTVTNRVCELRKELCAIEMSEYIYIDHTLIKTHMTPQDVCFNRPNYFPLKRSEEYDEIILEYLKQQQESNGADDWLDSITRMKKESVFTQTSERDFCFEPHIRTHSIAITQSREAKDQSQVEMFERDLEETDGAPKAEIFTEASQSMDGGFVRNWFREMYDASEKIDKCSPEARGGSFYIMPEETSAKTKSKRSEKSRKSKPSPNKVIKKISRDTKQWYFSEPSPTIESLKSVMDEYNRVWKSADEMNFRKAKPYLELLLPDKYAELRNCQEMHQQVDKNTENADTKMKNKNPKRKCVRTSQNTKAKKREKSKSDPDLTATQSTDSLIYELVTNGIMINVPKKSLEELVGDYNYLAYEKKNAETSNPKPCLGELKTTLLSWIIGMGPLDFAKTKSICLLGPPGCGKKHIIYAVAAELGAVVFNLSSEVVCKYRENMPYFVHFVTKMAKILQPVVLFIDGAHKPFIKKAPTQELKDEFKILGKFLTNIMNSFQPSDRVLLMGATNEPWNASISKMRKCFEKFMHFPTEHYADKFLIWQTALQNRLGIIPNIELSSLVKVNLDYSVVATLNAIDQVLTTSRMNRLDIYPLKAEEFMVAMSSQESPLERTYIEKYEEWFVAVEKLTGEENVPEDDAAAPKKTKKKKKKKKKE